MRYKKKVYFLKDTSQGLKGEGLNIGVISNTTPNAKVIIIIIPMLFQECENSFILPKSHYLCLQPVYQNFLHTFPTEGDSLNV